MTIFDDVKDAWTRDGKSETLNQSFVDQVFHEVAENYDLMNDLMSAGAHRLWKSHMVSDIMVPRTTAFRALDLAGGTGDIAKRICAKAPLAEVTILDINFDMLGAGVKRAAAEGWRDRITFCQANAEVLPFESGTFDLCTIAFGIRNVPERAMALQEIKRVLRPGGQFACLEFSAVELPFLDQFYATYSDQVIPRLGKLVAGKAEPYAYLVESIKRFPDAPDFAEELRQAGFTKVSHQRLTGGIAALHKGWNL